MRKRRKILFGILNWGLGHATRSIPIIQKLINHNYEVILASDGEALNLLQKEFPQLICEKLSSYNIRYSKKPYFFSLVLLSQIPHIIQTIKAEHLQVKKLVDKYHIDLIISDNRFGFRDSRINNIYITHQLQVLSGLTTPITTWLHALIYNKFDSIWVPDYAQKINLSGKLGHTDKIIPKVKYIGSLHRLKIQKLPKKYDILAVLSGPEPQRKFLEKELISKFKILPLKTAIVQGSVKEKITIKKLNNIDIYNYLPHNELEKIANRSEIIISRSGYTSVMDWIHLKKRVIWIPTPGQKEQEYLAKYLQKKYSFEFQKQGKIQLTLKKIPSIKISLKNLQKENIIELIGSYLN